VQKQTTIEKALRRKYPEAVALARIIHEAAA